MIFVFDIGNSNIVIAIMDDNRNVIETRRIQTEKQGSLQHFMNEIKNVFEIDEETILGKIRLRDIEGVVISSVVPEVTDKVSEVMKIITGKNVLVVKNDIETGIIIATDFPDKVGTDLIVDSVAAMMEYGGKIVIFDMGTATTCSVVDEGTYLGTIIIPGVAISNEALVKRASQLPPIEFKAPKNLIGKNTIESMQSGIVYASAAMVDGLIKRVEDSLNTEVTVIATGGIAGLIIPYCERNIIYEPDLLLKGLWYLYDKNRV